MGNRKTIVEKSSFLNPLKSFFCIFLGLTLISVGSVLSEKIQKTGLSDEDLIQLAKNFEYRLSDGSRYRLEDGKYEAGDSLKDYARLRLADLAIGDLNGDGKMDVAVVLVSNFGGSGHFYELTALLNDGRSLRQANNLELGDRVNIESLEIEDQRIRIMILTHGPDDPMCCPSQEKELVAYLKGGKLVLM
ncbi:MAG: hypothetical protein QME28_05345 [Candidatus Saccharicenans sp.]|nr:hypothetical protein [Candidatus Saccharicenans sp.]